MRSFAEELERCFRRRSTAKWSSSLPIMVSKRNEQGHRLIVRNGRLPTSATRDGKKELIAVRDGYRESDQSWMELLFGLRHCGLEQAPECHGTSPMNGRVSIAREITVASCW